MKKFHIRLIVLFCLALCIVLGVGFRLYEQSPKQKINKVPLVSAAKLHDMLLQDNVVLLDTRSTKEFKSGHLENARFINFDTFSLEEVQDIPKDAHLVIYCHSGYRSNQVGMQLLNAGYQSVQNMEGGIMAWKEKGYKVVYD